MEKTESSISLFAHVTESPSEKKNQFSWKKAKYKTRYYLCTKSLCFADILIYINSISVSNKSTFSSTY